MRFNKIGKIIPKNSFGGNVILSFSAQAFSLLTSFVLGFIVPKLINEYQYSYWQIFVLYVGYAGLLHFGLLDGIVLRYSQYDYKDLDKDIIRSQFRVLFIGVSSFCVIGFIISIFGSFNTVTKWVIALVSLGIISKNIFGFVTYSFQMTNQISKYTLSIIIQRVTYAVIVLVLIFLKFDDFRLLCISEIVGDFAGICYAVINSKELYFGRWLKIKSVLQETKINLFAGVFLLIANLSSSLILGGAKMVVNIHWDALTFGKISFAFSVSSLFLVFSSATSVVFFPSLKRTDIAYYPTVFSKSRRLLSCFLFFLLLFYFPLLFILNYWLPNYSLGLRYLGVVLPLTVFSAKISLITDNFMKAYRKEQLLFKINLFFMGFAILLFIVSAFLFNNLGLLLVCVVLAIMLKSLYTEWYLMKLTGTTNCFELLYEFVMSCLFVISSTLIGGVVGMIVYFIAFLAYSVINRDLVIYCFSAIGKRIKRD